MEWIAKPRATPGEGGGYSTYGCGVKGWNYRICNSFIKG